MSAFLSWRLLVAAVMSLALPGATAGQAAPAESGTGSPARVLLLDLGDPLRPTYSTFTAALRVRLRERLARDVQFVVEHIEPRQGLDSSFVASMASWLSRKVDLASIDAVVLYGVSDSRIVRWLRPAIPLRTPIVFYARGIRGPTVSSVADSLPNVVGVNNGDFIEDAIPLIWQVLPATRQVVGITDTEVESSYVDSALRARSPRGTVVTILTRPTVEDLVALSETLPTTSVFLYTTVYADRTGRTWIPSEYVTAFAPQVAQPVFVLTREHIGPGVLGGLVVDSKVTGEFVADRVAEMITGSRTETKSVAVISEHSIVWRDWSMMDFGIRREALPERSVVLEMEPSVWVRYPRGSILVTGLGIILILLSALLFVRNRRVTVANRELQASRLLVVRALASVTETRDTDTGLHIRRTQEYMREICLAVQKNPRFRAELSDAVIDQLYLSAPLHDIGKVGIPDAILHKPGVLTPEERAEMQRHTTIGREMLERAQVEAGGDSSFLQLAKEIAQSHHEKWDGTGYPEGLRGAEIPLSARLMALADVYDALRSERPYKIRQTHDDVERFILAERGRHFDPDIVDAFAQVKDRFIAIATRFGDVGD